MNGSSERLWMNQWPQHVPRTIDYPEIPLGQLLHQTTEKSPGKPALYYTNDAITFNQLDLLVDSFGLALQDFGVAKGDRVAVYLPNLPHFVVAYYGALRVGAVIVAISPAFKERELLQILTDSDPKVVVCWDRNLTYVQAVRDRTRKSQVLSCSAGESLLHPVVSAEGNYSQNFTMMSSLLSHGHKAPKPVEIEPKKDLALLQYTGGTTGEPKGAMITHYNLVVNTIQFSSWLGLRFGGEVHLSVLPFFHIYGMTVAMNVPVYSSSPMVLISDPRNTTAILEAIDRHKPTIFCGVPAMYVALINQPDIGQHNLHSIRVCVSGASPLPLQVQRDFENLTGGRLVEGYGLTEASPVTHVNPLDDQEKNRLGSIGIPISDTDAKILNLESGGEVSPGTIGELVIRGPQVMLGYWNNSRDTNVTLSGGWLHTGDIAVMDHEGYFRIIDRKDDMINVSGLKVWPREVEEVLYEHPTVRDVAVIAIPDMMSGDAVKAFVVLKEQFKGKVTQAELTEFCRQKIASYKAPRVIEFRDALPTSSVGKILRRELRTSPSR